MSGTDPCDLDLCVSCNHCNHWRQNPRATHLTKIYETFYDNWGCDLNVVFVPFIMKTHFLSVVPLVLSITKGCIFPIVSTFSVLATSIVYWRHPKPGKRRNLDVATVMTTACVYMYQCPSFWVPRSVMCFGIWGVSNYMNDSRIHSLIHILGSASVSCWVVNNERCV